MGSNIFHNADPLRASAELSSDDDLLQGANGSPFRPFMDTFYSGDGMNQDDTMSGAMPPSTGTTTQQPTMSGALLEEPQAPPPQDKELARDRSDLAMQSALASEELQQAIATTDRAPSSERESIANSPATNEDRARSDEAAQATPAGGREASVDLGEDRPYVRVEESTEVTEIEINGQSVVIESHAEIIEETGKEATVEEAQDEQLVIEERVETVIETPLGPSQTETPAGEAMEVHMDEDIAGSPSSGAALEEQQPSSPDSGSATSILAGTPQSRHQDPAIGSMSVPPKRKTANVPADSGVKRRRRTAADMLIDASTSFVASDYSDRKKRFAPIQPSSSLTATPVKTTGRKKPRTAAVPRVAALKTPKARPAARKSMAAGPAASPAAKVRTPRSAPGKVAGRPPKSAIKTPAGTRAQAAAVPDETPKRRGRPPKNLSAGTPVRTPARTPAKTPAKAPATEPARKGRPVSAGKRASPLEKRHSLSARLSAPKVTKVESGSTPAKGELTPKSGAKAKIVSADPPKRRGRPPKNASSSGANATTAPDAKLGATASKRTRGAKTKEPEEAPTLEVRRGRAAKGPASSTGKAAPKRGRAAAKTIKAEPAKPATTATRRPTRTAKAEAKASISETTGRAKRSQPSAAPKATETPAEAPKRRGRPPKAAAASTVTPPASKKRGRGAAKEVAVEPQPKKQKTTRQIKTVSAPEPAPEPVKKNKGGRPPKKTPSTGSKNTSATEEPAGEQHSTKSRARGRPKQMEPVSAPEPPKTTRGRGRAGKGAVAVTKEEKPVAKAAKKTGVSSGRVTKTKPKGKAAPRGAGATRSLRSRT